MKMIDPGSHLCTSCNLCCNGTLFDRIPLQQSEANRLRDLVNVQRHEKGDVLKLPCRQLGADGACGCYQTRPKRCADYKCGLLLDVEADKVPVELGLAVIARVKDLSEMVVAACKDATPVSCWDDTINEGLTAFRALKDAINTNELAAGPAAQDVFFLWAVYKAYVNKHLQSNFGELDEMEIKADHVT